jgi:hypothetical protein
MSSKRKWATVLVCTLVVLSGHVAHAGSMSPVVTVPVVGVFNYDSVAHGEVLPAVFVQVERRQDQGPLCVILKHQPGMVGDDYQERLESALGNGLARLNHDAKGLTVTIGFAGRFRFTGGSLLGAVVIGTVAALEGRSLAPNLVLTATVEPDGSLGPIADLEVKIAGAGSYTVLYPFSQISNVPNHLTPGLTSRPVRTLQEARVLMLP